MHQATKIQDMKEISFLLPYKIYLITFIAEMSFYARYLEGVTVYIYILCVLLLAFREIAFGKLTKKSIFITIIIAVMCIIGFKVRRTNIVYIMLFVFAGRNVSFKKIAKETITVTCSMLMFVILSAYLGIIENCSSVRMNGNIRYYLGFRYALFAPAFFTNVVMLSIYIKREKLKIYNFLVIIGISYWLYVNTDSRLSFFLTLCVCLIAVLLKKWPDILNNKKIICFILASSFVIFSFASIYFTIAFNRSVPWQSALNKLLTGRLTYGKAALIKYGVSLIGQRIEWIGNGLDVNGNVATGDYMYVDCLYVQVLLNYGIFFFVLYIILFTATAFISWRKQEFWLLAILFIIALHGVIDDNGLNLAYCTFWFAVSGQLLAVGKSNFMARKYKKRT